jgi:S-adenosylmethionine/arginine decarboxylase-like enzyme
MTENSWGYHLILDVKGCDLNKSKDPIYISDFVKELVKRIDMVPFGEPHVLHFGEGELTGWTVLQFIQTSNIVGHFIDSNGDLYFDVFSCRSFEKQIVLDMLEEYFSPENIKHEFLIRQA